MPWQTVMAALTARSLTLGDKSKKLKGSFVVSDENGLVHARPDIQFLSRLAHPTIDLNLQLRKLIRRLTTQRPITDKYAYTSFRIRNQLSLSRKVEKEYPSASSSNRPQKIDVRRSACKVCIDLLVPEYQGCCWAAQGPPWAAFLRSRKPLSETNTSHAHSPPHHF